MASSANDVVTQLAKKPLHIQLAILAGVLAVLGFLYWQFFYSALSERQDQLTAERRKLAGDEKKLKQRQQEWKELLQKKAELDVELSKNQVTLPTSSELPAFFGHLQKQAATAGVNIRKWSRGKESQVGSYIRVPVAMNVSGTFYQLNNYFRLLAQADRIITVENLSLGKPQVRDDQIVLNANFVATTFRQKDRPPDTSFADVDNGPPEDAAGGEDQEQPSAGGSQ